MEIEGVNRLSSNESVGSGRPIYSFADFIDHQCESLPVSTLITNQHSNFFVECIPAHSLRLQEGIRVVSQITNMFGVSPYGVKRFNLSIASLNQLLEYPVRRLLLPLLIITY